MANANELVLGLRDFYGHVGKCAKDLKIFMKGME